MNFPNWPKRQEDKRIRVQTGSAVIRVSQATIELIDQLAETVDDLCVPSRDELLYYAMQQLLEQERKPSRRAV